MSFRGKQLTALLSIVLGISFSLVYAATRSQIESAIKQPDLTVYSPRDTLSFYFQDIEIRTLLQLIAKNSGLNFIISDNVKGNITLNLKSVTWNEALKIILKTQGLTSRRIGNVIYISTIDDITSNETKELKSAEALANLAPIQSLLVRLKYLNATDLAALLKGPQGSLLTLRGEVAVDARTNSLIVRDTSHSLIEVRRMIHKLDIPSRQVLIEARIVNIDTIYERELGIRFGLSNAQHLSGTLAGANQLTQKITPPFVTPFTDRLNFNIPANTLFDASTPGSIAIALAHIGPALLDLELSALEGENHAQIISRPRVITSNQTKATIQTGEEIPYQESTSSGATSVVFKKAVLSLEITPQITPDNKIILQMKATQDSRGTNTAVGQQAGGQTVTIPAINTEEVTSTVQLNNNETIVLGGVYRTNNTNTLDRIPFIGELPFIGALFTHRGQHLEKRELLIFLTPKIIAPYHPPVVTAVRHPRIYKDMPPLVYKDMPPRHVTG